MVMRRHVVEENARRAAPTVHWSIAHLPERQLEHAWPFPVSVTADGMVRNVAPPPAPKKKRPVKGPGSPRIIRCSWGDPPPSGSVLVTSTGRRYLVALVRGRTLHTILLATNEGLHRPHIDLVWDKKGTKKAAVAAPKKPTKKKPRMDWCRGWALNAQRVAAGLKPNRHQWPEGVREDTTRCLLCKREWAELWATGSAA